MVLMAAVDDSGGMMFNKRRQSQDRALRERILALSARSRLWVSPYTAKQFAQDSTDTGNFAVDSGFLDKAGPGEYCFVEDTSAAPYESRAEQIILFKWNRRYPADLFFDIDLSAGGWKLSSAEDFPGSSHEKITMEVYVR